MALERASTFSRTRYNEQKMGAYYTDPEHCRDIGKLLSFPANEEVCVLEPCIGDAKAVISLTGADERTDFIKIFGVELEPTAYEACAENPYLEKVINADFTNGVYIRRNAFSFCFGNPPYMVGDESGERMEKIFLSKCTNYLKTGGVIVWVIPHRVFAEEKYLRFWMRNYDTEAIYRFRDEEFQKWKQIVVIGRKVPQRDLIAGTVGTFLSKISSVEKIPVLPSDGEATIMVPPSASENIDLFAPLVFDGSDCLKQLSQGFPSEIGKVFQKLVTPKQYAVGAVGDPPIPPKKAHLYLMAMSGCGQGLTGSLENKDLHLQRGVAEVVESVDYGESDYEEESRGSDNVAVTTSTKIKLTVIENDGRISVLE